MKLNERLLRVVRGNHHLVCCWRPRNTNLCGNRDHWESYLTHEDEADLTAAARGQTLAIDRSFAFEWTRWRRPNSAFRGFHGRLDVIQGGHRQGFLRPPGEHAMLRLAGWRQPVQGTDRAAAKVGGMAWSGYGVSS